MQVQIHSGYESGLVQFSVHMEQTFKIIQLNRINIYMKLQFISMKSVI
jgi:hypothetical protein